MDLLINKYNFSEETEGTLRYQDGELRRGRHCKSKTGMSPVIAAKTKILKCLHEKTRQNQAGGDTAQITDFALSWHKCWVW